MKQINREAEKALRELAEEWKADSFLATADEFSIELLTLIDQCQVQEVANDIQRSNRTPKGGARIP